MFEPPEERLTVRGSAWGPLSAYGLILAAVAIVLWGLRGSLLAMLTVVVIVAIVSGLAIFIATGTRVEVDEHELVVSRRWRSPWRVPTAEFRYIVENTPARPTMPAIAGWTFHAASGETAKLEISAFSPADRRRIRAIFRPVIIDADAGMTRR